MRNKLIELLAEASIISANRCTGTDCDECCESGEACFKGFEADHLLANGVTIGKEDNVVIKCIDLVGKCGSCRYFNLIESTTNGECLKSPYGDDVVHDPKHPYRIVPRSKIRCVNYWMRTPEPPKENEQ